MPRASANTIDVQAQINAIITQIASLKLQLADLTGNTMLGSDNNTPTNNLVPTITSISPSPVIVGGAGRSYTVTGTGFVSGSVVNLNGSARLTTYTSATQLSVYLPYTDIAAAGTFNITVANPNIVGTSNSIQFTVPSSKYELEKKTDLEFCYKWSDVKNKWVKMRYGRKVGWY